MLVLGNCPRVSDEGSGSPSDDACPALRHLSLYGCNGISDNTCRALSRHCTQLHISGPLPLFSHHRRGDSWNCQHSAQPPSSAPHTSRVSIRLSLELHSSRNLPSLSPLFCASHVSASHCCSLTTLLLEELPLLTDRSLVNAAMRCHEAVPFAHPTVPLSLPSGEFCLSDSAQCTQPRTASAGYDDD